MYTFCEVLGVFHGPTAAASTPHLIRWLECMTFASPAEGSRQTYPE